MRKIEPEIIQNALIAIKNADSLIITAGAGMGVDSGLPDFRGNTGFWKAYPALAKQHFEFSAIASPYAFKKHPEQAWGFYAHRLNLYRETIPHQGFNILKTLGDSMKNGYFVYTSNVDGQFQKAGFDEKNIVEIHGSIHHLQCLKPCKEVIFSAQDFLPTTNDKECLLTSALPVCNNCGDILRPNILMFDDWHWIAKNYHIQSKNYKNWLSKTQNRVIIELGAGTAIPSIRNHGEQNKGFLIRINPRESQILKSNGVSINCTALEGLQLIHKELINPRSG